MNTQETKPSKPTFQQVGKLENMSSGEVHQVTLSQIKPSPENDLLYKPYDPADRQNQKLTADIRADGILSKWRRSMLCMGIKRKKSRTTRKR